jgi:hypothetical protein
LAKTLSRDGWSGGGIKGVKIVLEFGLFKIVLNAMDN